MTDPTQSIKVLEIRACANGFVLTKFKRETSIFNDRDGTYAIFETYVARDVNELSALVGSIAATEMWNKAVVNIPPARGDIRAPTGKERPE